MLTYIINLDRSKKRLQEMTAQASEVGFSFIRISAVDGNSIDLSSYDAAPNYRYPYSMTPGEIGCFLSHRLCWEKFLQTKEQWCLILEDDCVFSKNARKYLITPDWIPDGVDLVQPFYTKHPTSYIEEKKLNDDNCLLKLKGAPVGAFVYIISRRAAKRALELSWKIEGPVDNFLSGEYFELAKEYPTWRLLNGVVRADNYTTTIEGRKEKDKALNRYRLNPSRLFKKIQKVLTKPILKSVHQVWHP